MRKWVGIVVSVLLIGGSTAGFWVWMTFYERDYNTMITYKPSIMIYPGEMITEDKVRKVEISKAAHFPEALIVPEDIIGKRAIVPIGEMEEFLPWKLSNSYVFPESGEQLFTFPIGYMESVGNMVRRGDSVHVWLDLNEPEILPDGRKVYSKEIFTDIKVAYVKDAAGKEIVDSHKIDTLDKLKNLTEYQRDSNQIEMLRMTPSAPDPKAITLIMTPEQYLQMVEAYTIGKVRIGLDGSFVYLSKDQKGE